MRVLVACEESQEVCKAFRERGHEAYSCDIQECSGGHPEWHIKADALELIKMKWDLIIAHPPCTYLARSSGVRLYTPDHQIKDPERYEKGKQARAFFMEIYHSGGDDTKLAIENPVPLKCWNLPRWDQIIEPFYFGEDYRKKTCLWLRNLPPLFATEMRIPRGLWVGSSSKRDSFYELKSKRDQKTRAKTFPGIAKAMAEQWG